MGQPARVTLELNDFPGLVTNMDDHEIPEGAGQIQTNAVCLKVSQLAVRKGYREVVFEN